MQTKPTIVKTKNRGMANFIAMALLPLSGFATDIYLPSLPNMATSLHVGNIEVQFTLTLFLVSYGLSQLFIGSVLDSFGRYKMGMICLIIFMICCIVIANTHNIYIIYAMRILHGLTVGTIVVGKRAYFIDVFTGDTLKHYLSMFSIIWSTGPIIAPFIGGYLQQAFGWQYNFYFLAGYALLFLLLEYVYSFETLDHFYPFKLRSIAKVYANMLQTSDFILGLVMCGLAYCMVIIFNMTGPFIIEHTLHFSPIVAGYSSLLLGIAWMLGGFIGKATIAKPFYKRMVVNIFLQVCFVIIMLISSRYIGNLYTLLFFAFIIQLAAGYTFNNFFTYCLSRFPNNGGIASGLSGGMSYIVISICSSIIILFIHAKNEFNLALSYSILIVLSVIIMLKLSKVKLV
ncbi:MAG: MFS transporter [Bacteroidetes bacterium]|nr:MFS transporter [Bacteroidota bacterium]MBS1757955.1 MFS transporter [Bacteroidota bacterium]